VKSHSPASTTATSAMMERMNSIISKGSNFRLLLNISGDVYGDWSFEEQPAKGVTDNVYLASSMDAK